MSINKIVLEKDGLVVGTNQLVASGNGIYVGNNLVVGGTLYATNIVGSGGFSNGQSISVNNFTVSGGFTANGSTGTSGQVLTTTGSAVYWSAGGGGASVTISSTAPSSPSAGNMWYNTETGVLYIYYNDGDSSQWVASTPASGPSGYTGSAGIGGTAVGGGTDQTFWLNGSNITTSYTIPSNYNAGSFGPISIANNVTVTVGNTSNWTIV